MSKQGIITLLPFRKYASSIFAPRKPNGKLRLLVDLRKINTLTADDYTKNSYPVSTLSNAAQHLAGKSLFCKLGCSQAYHCLQMAYQRSMERIAIIFACRTFAYKRLAQDLSRSLSAVSRFSASTWTQLPRLTTVLETWSMFELQPIPLRILPGKFGQSSSAFFKQDLNWQLQSAISV